VAVITESDDERVVQAEAARESAARSHVVTEEPSLTEAAAVSEQAPPAADASEAAGEDADGDTDADESNAAAAAAGDSGDTPAGDAAEGDDSTEDKPKSRRARKNARLQKELADARDRIVTLEREAQEVHPPAKAEEPEADDFASWEEYAEAKAKFLVAQSSAPAAQDGAAEPTPLPASWGDVIDKYGDWETVAMKNDLAVNDLMVKQLIEMDTEGAETLYYLGNHPDEAKRIAAYKGETTVARELAKLSMLASKTTGDGGQPSQAGAANVAPTKITNAPPPITSTEGGGAQGRAVDLETASHEDFREIRRKQMALR
jgi:hypothetical protein